MRRPVRVETAAAAIPARPAAAHAPLPRGRGRAAGLTGGRRAAARAAARGGASLATAAALAAAAALAVAAALIAPGCAALPSATSTGRGRVDVGARVPAHPSAAASARGRGRVAPVDRQRIDAAARQNQKQTSHQGGELPIGHQLHPAARRRT